MAKKPTASKKSAAKKLDRKAMKSVKGGSAALLKIDGIKGESQDAKHKDWIE